MGKIKLSFDNKISLQTSLKINEEIQALLMPLLAAVENEAEPDTYAMLRAVQRLSVCQFSELLELNNNIE
ncbi:hypothetical protein ID850_14935 [Xenorhabdus sp. Flor]|uniref:hypothetical protein n=1 Tax=Xenorhabdus cabanillasii TaxID=351673 RepID=UPI0019B6C0B3|nr:hypothetical protein [Xenorhabdus sp. Flor]MBD2816023.1 hypothetical protein [Xenorhabdus sp. Flor]